MNDALLNHADTLATFTNLNAKDAETFLRSYPEFLPAFGWQQTQRFVTVLWREHFPMGEAVRLVLSVDRFATVQLELNPKEEGPEHFELASHSTYELLGSLPSKDVDSAVNRRAIERIALNYTASVVMRVAKLSDVWPVQFAIMFLATHPWRARFCPSCGHRFVADKQSRRYCGERCSHEARKKGKLASYYKNGKTRRSNKKGRAKKQKLR